MRRPRGWNRDNQDRRVRAYFFCTPPGPPEAAGYEHGLVALAEGLRSLGHEVAGNRNIWPSGPGWLIPETRESPEAFDIVLISHESNRGRGTLPEEFVRAKAPKRIYLDESDGWRTEASSDPAFPADLVLRSHYNRKFRYPKTVRPWAFGLTERLVAATAGGEPASRREPRVLCNFRIGHPVRDRLTAGFKEAFSGHWTWDDRIDTEIPTDPGALQFWKLTGRRHNPAYYERLKQAQGCLAFGGFFAPGLPGAPGSVAGRALYKAVQVLKLPTLTLTQFDSWRFWESLASGTVTVHGPLEAWGAQLPVMPEDGVHYVSYGGRGSEGDFPARWETVLGGPGARDWALKHYSPRPMAERMLGWLPL